MNELIIKNIDDELVKKIEKDAVLNDRSIQTEIQIMLQQSVRSDHEKVLAEMAVIRNSIPYSDVDSTDLIREERDHRL